jgi:hypothetical protein
MTMTNKEKLLQSVLSDETLIAEYKYDPRDYTSIRNAKYSPNSIVATIADIIQEIEEEHGKAPYKSVYNKIVDNLKKEVI